MSQAIPTVSLPSAMEEKLARISQRQAVLSVLRAVALGASMLFVAMVVAMLIDWQFTLFHTGIRMALTVTAVLLAVGSVLFFGVPTLMAALERLRAATNADAEIPQLEERWQTVVSLANSGRRPTSPTAMAMLRQVTSEAVAIGRVVQPYRVADSSSLKPALKYLLVSSLTLVGFLAIDWPRTSVLLRRFCAPTADISATSLNCSTGDVSIPRGEFVDLVTGLTGFQRKSATLTIVRPGSKPESIELAVDPKKTGSFVHRLLVDDSFKYRVRAGDGQTAWHTVTAIDYPSLAEVRFTIIAPAYLNRPNVEKTVIPGRLKVMQGSVMQLQMRPKSSLARLELTMTPDAESKEHYTKTAQVYALTPDADGWYRFDARLMEDVSLSPQLWNSHGLTDEDRSVCRIQVIEDNAPVARVLSPTDEMAVAKDDVIDIKFEANDDHGIASVELVVYEESSTEDGKPPTILKTLPIPLGDQHLEKHVIGMMQLDLKQLNLKPGTQISYSVRVTDNRSVSDEQTTNSSQRAHSNDTGSKKVDSDHKPSSTTSSKEIAEASNKDSPGDSSSKHGTSNELNEPEKAASKKATNDSGEVADDETAQNAEHSNNSVTDSQSELASNNTDPPSLKDTGNQSGGDTTSESANNARKTAANKSTSKPDKDGLNPSSEGSVDGSNQVSNDPIVETTKRSGSNKKQDSEKATDDELKTESQNGNSKSQTGQLQSPSGQDGKQPSSTASSTSAKLSDADKEKNPESTNQANGTRDPSNSTRSRLQTGTNRTSEEKDTPSSDEATPDNDLAKADETESDSKSVADNDSLKRKKNKQGSSTPRDQDENKDDPNVRNPNPPKAEQPARTPNEKTNKSDGAMSSEQKLAMAPQQSESGQKAETNRRRLKITERLSAVAESRRTKKDETMNVRQRVIEIDALLSEVETGLTRVVNREIPDNDRSAQFKLLDTQLGNVEENISVLRKKTRDEQYAFVGLQMVDIGRTHVTPARERVFVAIREAATASDGNSQGALQQVVRARELLGALLKRYDRVTRDRQLAESLNEGVKMYEVYVEKMQQLMREARQNQNPLERKMAIIEVGQDYLDRYAEVLTMRRDMMTEFGRILSDDPRLLARYLDLTKRRRASLRGQLSELSKRQNEVYTELSGWLAADQTQRDDLWGLAVELRMQASTQLAKDAAELGERIEKQFPLVLDATQQTQAKVVELGRKIAETARGISLEARRQIREPDAAVELRPKSIELVQLFVDLDATLEQLNFENSKQTEVSAYVTGRLLESRTVADQAESWKQTARHVHDKRYHGLAEVDQHRLTIATELLRIDMQGIEADLSAQFQQLAEKAIPDEIASLICELQRLMEEITFEQGSATFAMTQDRLPTSEKLLKQASDDFVRAEELFDRIRRAVVAALDEVAVRNPNIAELEDPRLDEFLARLEREPNIEARLGIPNRPRNLRVIAETLEWQQSGGAESGDSEDGGNGKQNDAKPMRGEQDKLAEKPKNELTDAEREQRAMAREMEENLAKALAEYKERANDPAADREELKKLDQAAKDLQEKLDQMNQNFSPEARWMQTKEELEKTLATIRERTKDPSTDPGELKKLEQIAKALQQQLDQLIPETNPENLWKQMKEDLEKAMASLKERGDQPLKDPADLQKLEQITKDLQRVLEQMDKETKTEARWKLMAEFERKKEILKALIRGEHIPDEQWNKLLSTLDDGLWQFGGRTLPEEYRKAIEQYQEQIRRLTNHGDDDR